MGLCQLKSSSRVSVRERLWHDGSLHRKARVCGTVPAGKFVSRVRPRALCWPKLGPVCYGWSIAVVAL